MIWSRTDNHVYSLISQDMHLLHIFYRLWTSIARIQKQFAHVIQSNISCISYENKAHNSLPLTEWWYMSTLSPSCTCRQSCTSSNSASYSGLARLLQMIRADPGKRSVESASCCRSLAGAPRCLPSDVDTRQEITDWWTFRYLYKWSSDWCRESWPDFLNSCSKSDLQYT